MKKMSGVWRLLIFALLLATGISGYAQQKKKDKEIDKRKEKIGKEIKELKSFIQTIVSKSNINSSDTLMLTYKLYTTRELNDMIDSRPFINNFDLTEITPRRQEYGEEKIKGTTYRTIELRKFILQPIRTGVQMIPPRTFMIQYSFPTGRIIVDFWGDRYEETVTERKELIADEVKIEVMDLIEL